MKASLQPGIGHRFRYRVPEDKLVPGLYPEAAAFQAMPRVFATGFMVGLCEWACIEALMPHLDWPREQSVGVHVDLSHTAATPPGFEVTVECRLEQVEGRRLRFRIRAHDGIDTITEGFHERMVIDADRFNHRVAEKATRNPAAQ